MTIQFFSTYTSDAIGKILGTGYNRFSTDHGIKGLAKVNHTRLDLLAIVASRPGTGQFRDFIEDAKKHFDEIVVWEVWNKNLEATLLRYGFGKEVDTDCGEVLPVLVWRK